MEYLKNVVKFLIKNWRLAIPLFVLTAIAYLLDRNRAVDLASIYSSCKSQDLFLNLPDLDFVITLINNLIPTDGGLLLTLFAFFYTPVTYGLINKSLDNGSSNLNDIGQSLSQNLMKYIVYFIGLIALGIALAITFVIVLLVLWIISLIPGLGGIISSILLMAVVIALMAFYVLLSMWFAAMTTDGLDVYRAARKSIETVRTCFWTVIGITLLIGIACGIAGWILQFLGAIPLLGPVITSIAPAVQAFAIIVFLLMVYREKTGRINNV